MPLDQLRDYQLKPLVLNSQRNRVLEEGYGDPNVGELSRWRFEAELLSGEAKPLQVTTELRKRGCARHGQARQNAAECEPAREGRLHR
jgi:hypothetical protein